MLIITEEDSFPLWRKVGLEPNTGWLAEVSQHVDIL